MIGTRRLVLRAFPLLRATLVRHYGWRWPWALARCIVGWRSLVGQTRWAGRDDEEASQARALVLVPALYLVLRERLGASALEVAREFATRLLTAARARLSREGSWLDKSDPRARWHAFFDQAVARGLGSFNESECLSVEVERFHFRVRRCLLADLARDTGLPELARMTCDLVVPFCRGLLPDYEFRRNGSLESTLAYGHPYCDYVWEPKVQGEDQAPGGGEPRPEAGTPTEEQDAAVPAPDPSATQSTGRGDT